MILLNHTEHAIMLGDVLLIPAKPCKVPGTLKSLKDKYPALADYKRSSTAGAVRFGSQDNRRIKAVCCKQQRRFIRKGHKRRYCCGN